MRFFRVIAIVTAIAPQLVTDGGTVHLDQASNLGLNISPLQKHANLASLLIGQVAVSFGHNISMCDVVISHEGSAVWPLMEGAVIVSQTKILHQGCYASPAATKPLTQYFLSAITSHNPSAN